MRRMFQIPLTLIGGAALVSGCTLSPRDKERVADKRAQSEAKLAKALAGLTPGKPETCLSSYTRNYQTKRYGDTILYIIDRNHIYRNDTTGGCSTNPNDYMVTATTQSTVCRGEIVRTVQPGINILSGSCSLGDFVLYSKK